MNPWIRVTVAVALAVTTMSLPGCTASRNASSNPAPAQAGSSPGRETPFVTRAFRPFLGERWIGKAIAYGPHRDGQRPGGPSPTRAELREDLRLMLPHWNLLRVYGSDAWADTLLNIIHRDRLDMRVVLGVYVNAEDRRDSSGRVIERFPGAAAENRRQIEAGVRLAARYPRIVVAVCVGNETQVFWSGNKVPPERLVEIVREVRGRTRQPVTVADDFNFWNKPESRAVADELDFVFMHGHPLWNGVQVGEAVGWMKSTLDAVQAVHPGKLVVIGETGWATVRNDEGDQGKYMKGQAGESQQAECYAAMSEWVVRERIPTFFFEAFDENWKGGARPDDAEKHWGLFRADRTPKQALAGKP